MVPVRLLRGALVAALVVAATVAGGVPASAANGPRAFLGTSDGAFERNGAVYVERGQAIGISFGVTGVSGPASVTLEASGSVTLEADGSGCIGAGTSVTCTEDVASGELVGFARIIVASTHPLARAGDVTATTPGGTSSSLPVWVIDHAAGTDMEFSPTDVVGHAGETVAVTITVVNHGPSPQPYWGLGASLFLEGARLVGVHGCQAGTFQGRRYECFVFSPTGVGERRQIVFDIAIDAEAGVEGTGFDTLTALTDPNYDNNDIYFQYRARPGQQGGGSPQGGGSGGGAAPVAPVATSTAPSATPVTATRPATTPTTASSTTTTARSAVPLADEQSTTSEGTVTWALAAGLGLTLLLGSALLVYLRHRRGATTR